MGEEKKRENRGEKGSCLPRSITKEGGLRRLGGLVSRENKQEVVYRGVLPRKEAYKKAWGFG